MARNETLPTRKRISELVNAIPDEPQIQTTIYTHGRKLAYLSAAAGKMGISRNALFNMLIDAFIEEEEGS